MLFQESLNDPDFSRKVSGLEAMLRVRARLAVEGLKGNLRTGSSVPGFLKIFSNVHSKSCVLLAVRLQVPLLLFLLVLVLETAARLIP